MSLYRKVLDWREHCWGLGFIDAGLETVLGGSNYEILWVKDPEWGKRWFADPFILDYNDSQIVVLAEEFSYSLRRGRIARLTINRSDYVIIKCDIILDLNTHVSFPFIFRKGNDIYIMPENSASGALLMYNYSDGMLIPYSKVSEFPLTDATIIRVDNEAYIMSTYIPNQNGRQLSIWKFDDISCRAFGKEIVVNFPSCKARNAGDFFTYKGKTYRPAQDCNKTYGGAMELQRIDYQNNIFTFVSVAVLKPSSKRFHMGMHTFNVYKDLIIIDGAGYRYPSIGGLVNVIYRALSSIKHLLLRHKQ